MRSVLPSGARLQCPECGTPVDAVEMTADEQIALDPCGHVSSSGALGVYPADVKPGRVWTPPIEPGI